MEGEFSWAQQPDESAQPDPTQDADAAARAAEREQVRIQQQIETEWWKEVPPMNTIADIRKAIERGEALRIIPTAHDHFTISDQQVRTEFRVLRPDAAALLYKIADDWYERACAQSDDPEIKKLHLIVTSMARTTEYQNALIANGKYPAAESSTHTKLGAFDIYTRWLLEHYPDIAQELFTVLEEMAQKGRINLIKEPVAGAVHVAINPNYGLEKSL